MSVILQPAASSDAQVHYRDTIANPIRMADHAAMLTSIQPQLDTLYPAGKAPVWGVTPGLGGQNQSKYDKSAAGDLVLFSAGGSIFSTATLTLKHHSAPLARALWQEDSRGQTWEYMYFLDEVRRVAIPYPEFNRAVGYASNYVIQGFQVLDADKSARFVQHFGLGSLKHPEPTTKDEFRHAVTELLGKLEKTDVQIHALARREQSYLRRLLFSDHPTGHCTLCGEEFPTELLVTAHIKRRAACTEEERIDASNVVMALCQFGCDDLYERGYLAVREDGIVVGTTKATTTAVQAKMAQVVGKTCPAFKASSAKYFEWNRTRVFRGAT